MPDKHGNYSEEEMRLLSESYSKINMWRKEKKIIENDVLINDIIKSTRKNSYSSLRITQFRNSGL